MILDKDAVEQLPDTLAHLIDDEKARKELSEKISEMAMREADEKIVNKIVQLSGKADGYKD